MTEEQKKILKAILFLPPYNVASNIIAHDAYAARALERETGKTMEQLKEELELDKH